MCACVCTCVRACVRAFVRACVRRFVGASAWMRICTFPDICICTFRRATCFCTLGTRVCTLDTRMYTFARARESAFIPFRRARGGRRRFIRIQCQSAFILGLHSTNVGHAWAPARELWCVLNVNRSLCSLIGLILGLV